MIPNKMTISSLYREDHHSSNYVHDKNFQSVFRVSVLNVKNSVMVS